MLHRELYGICDKVDGSMVKILTEDSKIFDGVINITEVEHDFIPHEGDQVKVTVNADPPHKAISIDAIERDKRTGKITQLTKSFAIIDDDTIYFITNGDETATNYGKNDIVDCVLIEGEYDCGKNKYGWRCVQMKKVQPNANGVNQFFVENVEPDDDGQSDTETESIIDESKMELEAVRTPRPNEKYYDMPYALYQVLRSGNFSHIKRYLQRNVPAELGYSTYKKRFHMSVYFEEIEMQISFEKYCSSSIQFIPEQKRFAVECGKISELRPAIAIGTY